MGNYILNQVTFYSTVTHYCSNITNICGSPDLQVELLNSSQLSAPLSDKHVQREYYYSRNTVTFSTSSFTWFLDQPLIFLINVYMSTQINTHYMTLLISLRVYMQA